MSTFSTFPSFFEVMAGVGLAVLMVWGLNGVRRSGSSHSECHRIGGAIAEGRSIPAYLEPFSTCKDAPAVFIPPLNHFLYNDYKPSCRTCYY